MKQELDVLVRRETFAQVVALLKPSELIVAVLRLEGLNDTQIGHLLDTDRATVSRRMARAQRRIARCLPEAAHLILGRERPRGRRMPQHRPAGLPLEQGWLCPSMLDREPAAGPRACGEPGYDR